MSRGWAGLAGLIAVSTLASAAGAADLNTPVWAPGAATDWTVTIGVEGRMLPDFDGSNRYEFLPFPLFDLRRAGTPPTFHSPRDGFGFGIVDTGRFRIGPAFKVRLGRNDSDDDRLQGLGDVDWTLEAGVFADFWPTEWLRTRVEVRQGIGGHHGIVSDLTADVVVPVTPRLTLSGGPRTTLETAAATSPYFSITPEQSVASGLPVYNAGGGFYSYGAGVQARYQWSPQWETHVFLEYQRLVGDAANSPIVTVIGSRDQFQVGLGVSYSFDMKALW